MRDYLVVTRGVDPVELERARMDYMTSGYDSGDKTPLEAVTYVSFQELATRVSHRNTGKVTNDPVADRMLARISKDENLHMVSTATSWRPRWRSRPTRAYARCRRGHRIRDALAPRWPASVATR